MTKAKEQIIKELRRKHGMRSAERAKGANAPGSQAAGRLAMLRADFWAAVYREMKTGQG